MHTASWEWCHVCLNSCYNIIPQHHSLICMWMWVINNYASTLSMLYVGPDCYSGHGRGYNGTVNVTRGGIPCQQWNLNYPHQHLLGYENHPELQGGHNYCRNPGERGERPWCFTTDRETRWDYCDIEECCKWSLCVHSVSMIIVSHSPCVFS